MAPQPSQPPPATRTPQRPAVPAQSRTWAPTWRVAGFGPDALMDQLEDTRRPPDDIACVVFRELRFLAGNTVMAPRTRTELQTVAEVLAAVPEPRIEIGSQLGPGRPLSTDPMLRAERVRIIRNELVALGIAPSRLMVDQGEAYERLIGIESRAGIAPPQSIGLCVR